MSNSPTRRRVRTRYYAAGRRHGWPARITRHERAALEECQQLLPLSAGWLLYFCFPLGTWQERRAALDAYATWRAGCLAWRQAFLESMQRALAALASWWDQNKATYEPLLIEMQQEGEHTGE